MRNPTEWSQGAASVPPCSLSDLAVGSGDGGRIEVLGRFGMRPMEGVRLTLICPDTHTLYSGMLPGYIAGHYSYEEVHISLFRLAGFAGASFLRDAAVGMDREARKVHCRDRPPVAYDHLSIKIGSTPQTSGLLGAATQPLRSSRSELSTSAGDRCALE